MMKALMAALGSVTWIGVMMLHFLRFGGSNLSVLVVLMVKGFRLRTFDGLVIPVRM